MSFPGINYVREQIVTGRENLNQTNITRTAYYLSYWQENPEVAWSFQAHLVSRNAGYQMSDLARHSGWADVTDFTATGFIPTQIAVLFGFLEAGNYMIFRDVYPQLEAYKWAKSYPARRQELFSMLTDEEFKADPFSIQSWRDFFDSRPGIDKLSAWQHDWDSPNSMVRRHAFAMVVNEQYQVQHRLIENNGFLKVMEALFNPADLIGWVSSLGFTRLCFPVADGIRRREPGEDVQLRHLLLYVVGTFDVLEERIQAGRDTFVGLFNPLQQRAELLEWAKSRIHTGSRTDYNRQKYSISTVTTLPGGEKYSPPIGYVSDRGSSSFHQTTPVWGGHLGIDGQPCIKSR